MKYFLSASRNDFVDVLCSDTYQSIVLVGHGTYNSWRATDGYINNWDILALKGRFREKDGEWFQLTCSTKDFSPVSMGELVMKPGSVFYYRGEDVKGYDLILDALSGFRHIKDETLRNQSLINNPLGIPEYRRPVGTTKSSPSTRQADIVPPSTSHMKPAQRPPLPISSMGKSIHPAT